MTRANSKYRFAFLLARKKELLTHQFYYKFLPLRISFGLSSEVKQHEEMSFRWPEAGIKRVHATVAQQLLYRVATNTCTFVICRAMKFPHMLPKIS